MSRRPAPPSSRRSRQRRRALPLAVLALAAFIAGLVIGGGHVPGEQKTVEAFAGAWRKGDYAEMRATLTAAQQRQFDAGTLADNYRATGETATTSAFTIGKPRKAGDHAYVLPVVAHTRSFGDVRGTVRVPLSGEGDDARIVWSPAMTFPGLRAGDGLERKTELGKRGILRARDNTGVDPSIKGDLGPIPPERAAEFHAAGYPDDAQIGISGLEKIFERRLAGTPGGTLRAGGRVLAQRAPRDGHDVRTTISPAVQRAAVAALGSRLGGVIAMNPQTGEVLGASGIAFSGLQPPGSTFKMI